MGRCRSTSPLARAFLLGLSLAAAGTVTGCGPDCKSGDKECNVCADMPARRGPDKSAPVACERKIAIDPSAMCAAYTDANGVVAWGGAPLFPGAVKGTLATYCKYEWQIDGTAPDEALLPLQSSDDCTYVTPQTVDPFAQWAHDQAVASVNQTTTASGGTLTRPQAAPTSSQNGGKHARVVVLDTEPDADPTNSSLSAHGETLAYLIRDIACASPVNCSVEVKTQLVMPLAIKQGTTTPVPAPLGGNMGSLGDVSSGIWAELSLFESELQGAAEALMDPNKPDNGPALDLPTRLVMNESFGWTGADCNNNPSQSTVAVKALFDAMQAAACLGAVHVAAAGNHTGGLSPSTGLMCPARWDQTVAPAQSTCETLFGAGTFQALQTDFASVTQAKYGTAYDLFDASGPSTDALVSVGAVDYGGEAIVMTRPDACPEAVALGVGGVAWDTTVTTPTVPPILFGTSMSAAVVSGRLAAEWSQPGAPAFVGPAMTGLLMAPPRSSTVTFVTGDACSHLQATTCDRPWISAPPTGLGLQNPALAGLGGQIAQSSASVVYTIRDDGAPTCGESIPQCVSETKSANPLYVWGQPTDPLCLKCGIVIDPTTQASQPVLWLDPSGKFQDANQPPATTGALSFATRVKDAVLVIEDASGHIVLTQPLKNGTVTSTSKVTLDIPGISLAGARAWLSAYDENGQSVSQQIFVHP